MKVAVLGSSAQQPAYCTMCLQIMHATPLAGLFVSNDTDRMQHDRQQLRPVPGAEKLLAYLRIQTLW